MNKAIVLISGGMDSLITTCVARQENDEFYLLHVNYRQRTEKKELEAFHKLCEYFKPKEYKIINIDYLKDFGGSSLIDENAPIPLYDELTPNSQLPTSYVPYRNGNLISIATSYAEVIRANKIYIGAIEVDGSGYPDCRRVYYDALESAINLGTKDDTNISLITPLINLKKSEIIKLGISLNAPFELSWSCYQNNDLACGVCDSCYLRLKAFKEVGIDDPIPYINKKL